MKISAFAVCVAFVVIAFPAAAATTTYHCTLVAQGKSGWVPEEVYFDLKEGAGEVTVLDGILQAYLGHEVVGKVEVNNGQRMTFVWKLPKLTNSSNQYTPGMSYRGTIQKSDLSVRITAKPLGYDDVFYGDGSCKKE